MYKVHSLCINKHSLIGSDSLVKVKNSVYINNCSLLIIVKITKSKYVIIDYSSSQIIATLTL